MAQSITAAIWQSNVVLVSIYNEVKAINAGLNIQPLVHGQLSRAILVLFLKFSVAFYSQESPSASL